MRHRKPPGTSFLCCWPSTSRTPIRPGVFPFRREELEFLEICTFKFKTFPSRLPDKNLNALKTSRYKTSPYLLEKKWCCQSRESNPGPLACLPMMLPTELWRLLLWTREILKFIYYYYQILHFCMQKKGRAGQGCCTVYTYNRTVGF